MERKPSYVLLWAVILASLFACQKKALDGDAVPVPEPVATTTVTLNFSIGTKAVSGEGGTVAEPPTDLNIWVYTDVQTDKPLYYKKFEGLNWGTVDGSVGQGQTEFYAALETVTVPGVQETSQKLKVYAVVNTGEITWSGVPDLATISETGLKNQGFTSISVDAHDNSVPMFGGTEIAIEAEQQYYSAFMSVTRCVARLDLFFTKNSNGFDVTINKITLSKAPEAGYLATPSTPPENTGETVLYNQDLPVTAILTRNYTTGNFSGYYSEDETRFNAADLSRPYIFEREGLAWVKGGADEIYPDGSAADAYNLVIDYTVVDNGTVTNEKEIILLSRIERNTLYRIFTRISLDRTLEVNTKAVPWVEGYGDYYFDVTPGLPVEGGYN